MNKQTCEKCIWREGNICTSESKQTRHVRNNKCLDLYMKSAAYANREVGDGTMTNPEACR